MNCPKCNAPLPDDAVFCSECGEEFAIEAQKGKVLLAKQRTKSIISDIIHSKTFFAYAIVLSLFAFFSLLSCVNIQESGFSINLLAILVTVFAGIAVYRTWSLYVGSSDVSSANIAGLSTLYKLFRIISQVLYILLIVVLALSFFPMLIILVSFKSPEFREEMMSMLDVFVSNGAIDAILYNEIVNFNFDFWIPIIFMVYTVSLGSALAMGILCHKVFKKTEKHLGDIANAAGTNQYAVYHTPSKFMFVMGCVIMGYWAVTTGASIAFGIAFDSLSIYGTATSLSTPLLGLCLIMLSFVFDSIHDFQMENLRAVQREQDILASIERRTNQAKKEAEDKKSAAEAQKEDI